MLAQLQRRSRHLPARPAAIEIVLIAHDVPIRQRNRLILHPRRRYVVRLPMLNRIIHLLVHQRQIIAALLRILINEQNNLIALIRPKLDLLLSFERRQVPRILPQLLLLLQLLLLKILLHHSLYVFIGNINYKNK